MSSTSVIDADAPRVPVALVKSGKLVLTGDTADIVKDAEVLDDAACVVELLGSVSDAKKLGETEHNGYCILAKHPKFESVAILLSKSQERAFVKRAFAKSETAGNVPWQILAAGKKVSYLGKTMTLSPQLSRSIKDKKSESVAAPPPPKKVKRPRTPSVSSSSEEEEEELTDGDEDDIDLQEYEEEDDEDLIDEDGGCKYSITIKVEGNTPRACKLAARRLNASLNNAE